MSEIINTTAPTQEQAIEAAKTITRLLAGGDTERAAQIIRDTRALMGAEARLTARDLEWFDAMLEVLESEEFAQVRGYWAGQARQG